MNYCTLAGGRRFCSGTPCKVEDAASFVFQRAELSRKITGRENYEWPSERRNLRFLAGCFVAGCFEFSSPIRRDKSIRRVQLFSRNVCTRTHTRVLIESMKFSNTVRMKARNYYTA